ncbi:lipase chaperone [Phyllobacterium sp. UNC302MFCol5.2]|uniref:lipase chaperone n=1 Tax=Phyllobacterium sp. UNC302MFCol5.2 TaxID=1449065 RepID=UPI00055D52A6|nr:lipase chaperone [Phyllobacterium sp. UNC302MFCol5.2]
MTYDPNLQQRPIETEPLNPRATAKSGSGGFLIAGILIAALIVGGYFYLNSGSNEMTAPAPTAPATTTAPESAKPEPNAMAPATPAPAPAETAPAPTTTPAPAAPAPAQ